jgi:hypothetical protein
VQEDPLSARVLAGGVVHAAELPLGGEESLHAHRAPRVDAPRRDAHLRTQTQPVAISKPRVSNNSILKNQQVTATPAYANTWLSQTKNFLNEQKLTLLPVFTV